MQSDLRRHEDVFKWFAQNLQWIFSGAGVALALGLLKLLKRARTPRLRAHSSPQPCAQEGGMPGRTPTLPSGNEIAVTVDNSPPFQRQQIEENYIGLTVSWPVIFFGLVRQPNGRCLVQLAYGAETWGAKIVVDIDIQDYPRLKTAPAPRLESTEKLLHGWLEGRIVGWPVLGMQIEPSKLEFFG
jgi:hypothetical protein